MSGAASIQLRILGGIDVRSSGAELTPILVQPKRLALLAYLALAAPGGYHRRDSLLAMFWPELDASHARQALSQAIHFLRRQLGPDVLVSRGSEELGVSRERVWCDAVEVRSALDRDDPAEALALYRGDLLPGFFVRGAGEFERWLEDERARLRGVVAEAAARLANLQEQAGDHDAAIHAAQLALKLAPFDEAVLRRLVSLLDRSGAAAESVHLAEAFVQRLAEELDVGPSEETVGLIEELRARRPAMRAAPRGTVPVGAPFGPSPNAPIGTGGGEGDLGGAGASRARAPATRPPSAGSAGAPSIWQRIRRLAAGKAAAGVLAVLVGVLLLYGVPLVSATRQATEASASAPGTIAVVALSAFESLGPAEVEHFADGITEAIVAQLTRIEGIRLVVHPNPLVTGPPNSERQGPGMPAADYVLTGTLRWQRLADGGLRVRVSPRVVRTADGIHIWAEVYEVSFTDGFRLQSELAELIGRALEAVVLPV